MPEVEDQVNAASGRVARPAPGPRAGVAVLVRLAIVIVELAVGGGAVWVITRATAPVVSPTTTEIPALQVQAAQVEPGSIAPGNATIAGGASQPSAPPQVQGRSNQDLLGEWASRAAPAVGIPARALVAYGSAELVVRSAQPGCKISWATLAGIGRIESNHGRYGGAILGADGRPSNHHRRSAGRVARGQGDQRHRRRPLRR
jgi:membrane-bound lytic murein transglycosylase B